MVILGIETSCDETAVAVVENGTTVLSNIVSTQVAEHSIYGGVVPEIASRRHTENISAVYELALKTAGVSVAQIDAVAVTYAPGLIGALLVGVNFAKGLSYATAKPLIPVHHLRGHIAALYLTNQDLRPPFLCLVASGGHSHIIKVNSFTNFEILGQTVDDAAGEAFDKVARALKLGYPGGPAIAKAALAGDASKYVLPTPKAEGEFNVSFSGLKTAVLNILNRCDMTGEPVDVNSMAAAFENKITDMLAEKLLLAARKTGCKAIAIAGGVAANTRLRMELAQAQAAGNAELYLPKLEYCGDNAAMIAAAAYFEHSELGGQVFYGGLRLNAQATLPIDLQV